MGTSAGRGVLTSGAILAAAARGLGSAAGRAAISAKAQLAARISTWSRGRALPLSGLQLIAVAARGLAASFGRAAVGGSQQSFVFTYAAGAFPLSAAGTFVGDWISAFPGASALSLRAQFTSGAGGNFVKVYFQTSLDKGASAFDLAAIKFTRLSGAAVANISASGRTSVFTPSAEALTPGALAGGVLGDRFRAVVVVLVPYAAPAALTLTGYAR